MHPGRVRTTAALPNARAWQRTIACFKAMQQFVHDSSLPLDDRIHVHFGLGKAWTELGEPERGFEHFLEGNRLHRGRISYREPRRAWRTRTHPRGLFRRFSESGGAQRCLVARADLHHGHASLGFDPRRTDSREPSASHRARRTQRLPGCDRRRVRPPQYATLGERERERGAVPAAVPHAGSRQDARRAMAGTGGRTTCAVSPTRSARRPPIAA